jgi:hypothetical protein
MRFIIFIVLISLISTCKEDPMSLYQKRVDQEIKNTHTEFKKDYDKYLRTYRNHLKIAIFYVDKIDHRIQKQLLDVVYNFEKYITLELSTIRFTAHDCLSNRTHVISDHDLVIFIYNNKKFDLCHKDAFIYSTKCETGKKLKKDGIYKMANTAVINFCEMDDLNNFKTNGLKILITHEFNFLLGLRLSYLENVYW